MELSKEAKRALVNTAPRRGASIPWLTASDVIAELVADGLATRTENLTDRGVMVRARILDEMLEAM